MVFPDERQRQGNYYPPMHHRPNRNMNRPAPKNNIQQMIQSFSNPQSSEQSIATRGMGGLTKTLDGVQQVLKVVQSTTPIVQEYGPMVKNIPAMYRMVKAFKEIENEDENSEAKSNTAKNIKDSESKNYKKTDGKSTPRLYI